MAFGPVGFRTLLFGDHIQQYRWGNVNKSPSSKWIKLVEAASSQEAGAHQLGEMLILLIKKNGESELDRRIIT